MAFLAAFLLTAGATQSTLEDVWTDALQSMHFMIGTWHCHEHIVGGADYDYPMTIATALDGSWLKADVAVPSVGDAKAWSEELYWTYVPLTEGWVLKAFDSGGNQGEFGAKWWEGTSIVWRGHRTIMGHHYDRAIKWAKASSDRIVWREFDTYADGSLTLMSAATCGKRS